MDKSIEQLARDLAFAEYAKTTQASYLATIRARSERKKTPIASWSRDDLRETFEWLRSLGKSAAWLKSKLCAVKFLFKRTLGKPEIVSFMKLPKVYSPLPAVLSLDEVHAFLRAIGTARYQAIAMVMYGAGLRISEAIALEVRDIDGKRGVLHVRHGKGNKAREAKMSPSLYQWLRSYWEQSRPPLPHLFTSRKTGELPVQATIRKTFA